MVIQDAFEPGGIDWSCLDCGVWTFPWEVYMTTDDVWAEALPGDTAGVTLCIGCLENRLDRRLVPEDFPPRPINDDEETDSVRLRQRKGSGRCSSSLLDLAAKAVVGLDLDIDEVARAVAVEPEMLDTHVRGQRQKEKLG